MDGWKIITDSQLGRNLGLFALVAIIWIIFSLLSPYFLTKGNIVNLLLQSSHVAIVSIGMTLVIIGAGIDLSVGSVASLSGMVTGIIIANMGMNFWLALVCGLATGAIFGFANGYITSTFSVQPMVVTLGTMTIARGLTLIVTSGRPVFVPNEYLITLGGGKLFTIPIPIYITAVLFAAGYIVLNYSDFGQYIYALGGNEEATRLAGVNVHSIKISTYVICGICSALAGIIIAGLLGSSEPTMGMGLELDAIAVVAIGGTSLFGGIGGLTGTILGALLVGTIENGLTLLNVVSYYQRVFMGVIIIVAVIMDKYRT